MRMRNRTGKLIAISFLITWTLCVFLFLYGLYILANNLKEKPDPLPHHLICKQVKVIPGKSNVVFPCYRSGKL